MAQRCCPRCRLLQRGARCVDCSTATEALGDLTRQRVAGVTTVAKPPATGWRDQAALWGTALGVLSAATGGALITHSALGMLAGPAVGVFGYSKQFWKTVLRRRPRLDAVAAPERPACAALAGTAQPFERSVAGGALAIATTVENRHGVIVRAVDAAAFWLTGERRILVSGNCWIAGAPGPSLIPASLLLREIEAGGFPISRASRTGLRVTRVAIMPGDRVSVLGHLREEAVAGLGGYRDTLTETLRGEPGARVWIDRLV